MKSFSLVRGMFDCIADYCNALINVICLLLCNGPLRLHTVNLSNRLSSEEDRGDNSCPWPHLEF